MKRHLSRKGLLLGMTLLLAETAVADAPTELHFQFAAGQAQFDRADVRQNDRTVQAVQALIERLAAHPSSSVVLVAPLPPGCRDTSCPAYELARQRVETVIAQLTFTPGQVRWGHSLLGNTAEQEQLQVLMQAGTVEATAACPFQVELLDPAFPAAHSAPTEAVWLPVAAGVSVPFSPQARLRLSYHGGPDQQGYATLRAGGTQTENAVPATGLEWSLNSAGVQLWLNASSAPLLASGTSGARTTGLQVQPLPTPETQGSGCRFVFVPL